MKSNRDFQQGLVLHRQGNFKAAARLYERALEAGPDDPNALHYLGLARMQLGDLQTADSLLERSLSLDPKNANTLSDLGIVKVRRKDFAHAIDLFSRALDLNDHHIDALHNLAATLNTLNRPHDALPILERLVALRPESAEAISRLAHTRLRTGDVHAAIKGFRKAVKLEPRRDRARILLGEALEAAGRFKQAQFQYLNVLERDGANVVALSKLLNLREGEIDHKWAEKATRLSKETAVEERDRIRLHVALGQYYDRAARYDDAFENFQIGYSMQFARAPFDSAGYSKAVDRQICTFTSALFGAVSNQSVRSGRPIFIVGMPRSGTTLTEQILASHSAVAAGGELSTIMNLGTQIHLQGPNYRVYPEGILDLSSPDLADLAKRYLERLDRVSPTADRVTDKQPFNFMHLGFIAVLLPDAKIIHCRRDPMDTCLSCYFVSFNDEFQFASNLETLGRYYLDYQRLMEHWRQVLPIPILDVQYEDLVTDTEKVVQQMLEYCGLPWEGSCLRFHETERGIRTPSRWQVRQPVYSGSIGRWKRYAGHLQPLQDILLPSTKSSIRMNVADDRSRPERMRRE